MPDRLALHYDGRETIAEKYLTTNCIEAITSASDQGGDSTDLRLVSGASQPCNPVVTGMHQIYSPMLYFGAAVVFLVQSMV